MKDLITMRRYRLLLHVVCFFIAGIGLGMTIGGSDSGNTVFTVGIVSNAIVALFCPEMKSEKQ